MRPGRRSPISSPTRAHSPARYNYGSSGNYGTMHVPMEMLKSAAGFRMTHIPFTGAGPAVVALLGGQVDAVASGPVDRRPADQGRQAARARALGRQAAGVAARRAEPEAARLHGAVRAVVGALRAGRRRRTRSCRAARGVAQGGGRSDGAADDRQGRQPGRVPRRAGVPGVLERRRGADDDAVRASARSSERAGEASMTIESTTRSSRRATARPPPR